MDASEPQSASIHFKRRKRSEGRIMRSKFFRILSVVLTIATVGAQAHAQTQAQLAVPAKPYIITGAAPDGTQFDASVLKGKVSMVFYWSTACAVCRSHLPELRDNLTGWKDKPFSLVLVNVDKNMADWKAYEKVANQMKSMRPISVWAGTQSAIKLPLTLVLDTSGRVVARYEGRIAPEAWDSVAEMLP